MRRKGEGSIIKDKTRGGYKAKLIVNGKTKIRRAKTQREAKEKLKELQEEFATELNRKTLNYSELTVRDYFTMFLEYKKERLGDVSYRRLESTVMHHIVKHFDYLYFYEITDTMIENRLKDAHQEGLSFSSVKKIHDAFNACYNYAIKIKKDVPYRDNPMLGVEMIPKKKFENKSNAKRILDGEGDNSERERFVNEAIRKYATGKYAHKYGAALVFVLCTGLREGEMCGLKRTNIDKNKKIMLICDTAETIRNGDGEYITHVRANETKYTSERYVPLNDRALQMIEIMEEQFQNSDLLVHLPNGAPLPPVQLTKAFKNVCSNSNIDIPKGVGCHCLRHTFASSLFEKGIDVTIISELLGHSSVAVTQNTYITIINRLKAEAVNLPKI